MSDLKYVPGLALDTVMTMDERVTTNLAKPRLYAIVLAGFGAFALAIAVRRPSTRPRQLPRRACDPRGRDGHGVRRPRARRGAA